MSTNDTSLTAVFAAANEREKERRRIALHVASLSLLTSQRVRP